MPLGKKTKQPDDHRRASHTELPAPDVGVAARRSGLTRRSCPRLGHKVKIGDRIDDVLHVVTLRHRQVQPLIL